MNNAESIKRVLAAAKRTCGILEEQFAIYGGGPAYTPQLQNMTKEGLAFLYAPPGLIIDLEDQRSKVAELENLLNNFVPSPLYLLDPLPAELERAYRVLEILEIQLATLQSSETPPYLKIKTAIKNREISDLEEKFISSKVQSYKPLLEQPTLAYTQFVEFQEKASYRRFSDISPELMLNMEDKKKEVVKLESQVQALIELCGTKDDKDKLAASFNTIKGKSYLKLLPALNNARSILEGLEILLVQKGDSNSPAHLKIDLEYKRLEVEELRKLVESIDYSTFPINPGEEPNKPQEPKIVRTKVFVSYSHSNQDWFEKLMVYLSPLDKRKIIDVWTDKDIKMGMERDTEIKKNLAEAKVAIVLISAEFINSEYISEVELKHLLEGVKILPVIVNPCSLNLIQFDGIQAANSPDKTLIDMEEYEWRRIFKKLTEDVQDALKD